MSQKRPVRGQAPWWAALVLASIGVMLAGVAASGARDLPGTGTSRRMAAELGLDPLAVISWLVLAFFAFVLFMVFVSPRGPTQRRAGGRRKASPVAVFLVMAVLAVIFLLTGPGDRAGGDGDLRGLPGEGSLAEAPPQQGAGSPAGLLVFGGVLIVTAAIAMYVARRPEVDAEEEPDVSAVIASVDAAIEVLEVGGDPRMTIIAAYTKMEGALAGAGVPRRLHEAPLEYLARSLSRLRVGEPAISRLTRLFEEARFSRHLIDEQMAEEAMGALSEVRSDLEIACGPS
jgi:hypothetical protein